MTTRTLAPAPEGTLLITEAKFDVSPYTLGLYLSLLQRDRFMLAVHRGNEHLQAALRVALTTASAGQFLPARVPPQSLRNPLCYVGKLPVMLPRRPFA